MTLRTPLKCVWLALILGAVGLTAFARPDARASLPPLRAPNRAKLVTTKLPNGEIALLDAGGHPVPLRAYKHIASGTSMVDDLLLALAEPERIAALTAYGRAHSADAHLYGTRPAVAGPGDLERLKQQGIDLLLLNHLGAPAELARVREVGIQVFNLGEMRGLVTLRGNIRAIALLLGDPARGERLLSKLERRLHAVSADIPAAKRKSAVYVSAYGGQLFGGGLRSSYHDVLTAAGLIDVAAGKFTDFPHYEPEHLLLLDPEIIVTQPASVALLCRISGLAHLRACADGGRGVVGVDDELLSDPGLGMLDAAEAVREQVYGD